MKHMLKSVGHTTSVADGSRIDLWECADCLEVFDYWPPDNMPMSECPGKPTEVTKVLRAATIDAEDAIAAALGITPEDTTDHQSTTGNYGVGITREDTNGD